MLTIRKKRFKIHLTPQGVHIPYTMSRFHYMMSFIMPRSEMSYWDLQTSKRISNREAFLLRQQQYDIKIKNALIERQLVKKLETPFHSVRFNSTVEILGQPSPNIPRPVLRRQSPIRPTVDEPLTLVTFILPEPTVRSRISPTQLHIPFPRQEDGRFCELVEFEPHVPCNF